MILSIFILIACLGGFLIVFGFLTEYTWLALVGFTFLFSLGVVLMSSAGVQYKTGANYTDTGTVVIQANNYTVYSDKTFGFYLALVSGFAFGIMLLNGFRTKGELEA